MKLLNVGCGYPRVASEDWVNLDTLHDTLFEGTPERANLDAEKNYIDHRLPAQMPFGNEGFDGILCAHTLEHFNCVEAGMIIADCHRMLRPGGALLVSVPDASYFRKVHGEDTKANSLRLFGEPMQEVEPKQSFFEYALWFGQHRQILCEDSMWALLRHGGFPDAGIKRTTQEATGDAALDAMRAVLNRIEFSLIMMATA